MRSTNSAVASATASGLTPTQSAAMQLMCRPKKGTARNHSMRFSAVASTGAAWLSNQAEMLARQQDGVCVPMESTLGGIACALPSLRYQPHLGYVIALL